MQKSDVHEYSNNIRQQLLKKKTVLLQEKPLKLNKNNLLLVEK